ncbi:MAG: HAD hydrolase-like protein [Alphaproteobacteria bacterium]
MITRPPISSLFNSRTPPAVLFDVDDTLAPTGPHLSHEVYTWISREAGVSYEAAKEGIVACFHQHGHVFWPIQHHFKLTDAHEPRMWTETTRAFHAKITTYMKPDLELNHLLRMLKARTALMAAFTANYREHGKHVVAACDMGDIFQARNIWGRACVDSIPKTKPESYALLKRRKLSHLPHGTQLVMVEDTAHNLPTAKANGIVTVYVGTAPLDKRHAHGVDYVFEDTHAAVRGMLGEVPPSPSR